MSHVEGSLGLGDTGWNFKWAMRTARETSGLSTDDLLSKSGTSAIGGQPGMARIESGDTSVSMNSVIEFADACGYEIFLVPKEPDIDNA